MASPSRSSKSNPFIEALIFGMPKGLPLTMPMKLLTVLLISGCGGHGFSLTSALSKTEKESPAVALRGGLNEIPVVLNKLDPNWWEATTSTTAAPLTTELNHTNATANQTAQNQTNATAEHMEKLNPHTEHLANIFSVNTEVYSCTFFLNMPGAFAASQAYWKDECKSIPTDAKFIAMSMGSGLATDYFRPLNGSSMCDMLTSSNKHQWSKGGLNWAAPAYAVDNAGQPYALGGSAQGWPASSNYDDEDHRSRLPFWGVMPTMSMTGGCCAQDLKTTTEAWSLPFKMSYCGVPKALTPVCTPIAAVGETTDANQAFWAEACKQVPMTAAYVKLVMGEFTDHFKPVTGSNYCDMLTSSNSHQWSKDGQTWTTPPSGQAQYFGGSATSFNSGDSRNQVSFWGSTQGYKGGCCFGDSGAQGWGHRFIMSYCDIPQVTPVADLLKKIRDTETSVEHLEYQLEGLHSRLFNAEKVNVNAAGNVSIARQGMFKLASKFQDEADRMKEVQSMASLSGTKLDSALTELAGAKMRVHDAITKFAGAAAVANTTATVQAMKKQDDLNKELWDLMNPSNDDSLDATNGRIQEVTADYDNVKSEFTEEIKHIVMTKMRRSVQKFRSAIMKLGSVQNQRDEGTLGELEGSPSLGDNLGFNDD